MSARSSAALTAALLVVASCDTGPTAVDSVLASGFPPWATHIVTLKPSGGVENIAVTASVLLTFNQPMQTYPATYALLEGDVQGAEVEGVWTWSGDRTQLRFTPNKPLRSGTRYVLHLGGGIRNDADGLLSYGHCVTHHNGAWVTQDMIGQPAYRRNATPAWRHPNGTYGMVFSFTTSPEVLP